jgi:hypothetical protein
VGGGGGPRKVLLFCIQLREQVCQQRIPFYRRLYITACVNTFCYIMLISIEGNSVVGSWEPSAMQGLGARLKKKIYIYWVVFELDSRNLVD